MNKTTPKTILISGASITGPALAYWLAHYGYKVTIVERAPALRQGGYAVDIRGTALQVIEKMGMARDVRAADTDRQGMDLVDSNGDFLFKMSDNAPGSIKGGANIEIMRDDLSHIIYNATKSTVEYIWGDSVVTLTQDDSSVDVTFEHHKPRRFDIVIGADGFHSNIRSLVFGDESQFVYPLGCYIAIFTTKNFLGLERKMLSYTMPGKNASLYSARQDSEAKAVFMFNSKPLHYPHHNVAAQKELLRQIYAGENGWELKRLFKAMGNAPDFYFDTMSQIRMPRWSEGRVALVGDAAYAASPASGQGTSLALVGAYILARKLHDNPNDHQAAFAAYQAAMREFVTANQALGARLAKAMIPNSRFAVWLFNKMARTSWFADMFNKKNNEVLAEVAQTAKGISLEA